MKLMKFAGKKIQRALLRFSSMCIFCKIVAGEIPAYKIYEDEDSLAFLDINPVNPGHALVISKKHAANLEEIEASDLQKLIVVVKIVGRLLKEKLGYAGYNVNISNDPVAGQEVPHLHFHLVPRKAGDGLMLWPHAQYAEGEAEEILRKLKS